MKSYKLLRWLLRGSALTAVMFVMQACYGSPYQDRNMPNPEEMNAEAIVTDAPASDTLVQYQL